MIYTSEADNLPFLKNLLQSLNGIAKKKNIRLDFIIDKNETGLCDVLNEQLNGFTRLISSVIDYVPYNNTIYLTADVIEKAGIKYISVKIRNTGINLKMVTAIIKNSTLPVTLFSSATNETTYEVSFPFKSAANISSIPNGSAFNYVILVKAIQNYFAKINNSISRLSESKPKEAAFLIKINKCILDNISNERFDANALSTAMAMSRAQLLRRLKALTGNSPGFYIKTMRLEKAKELLETSDLSVSEAAFKTGFSTPSNFTKVFSEKYGITPSQFRRINPNATNK